MMAASAESMSRWRNGLACLQQWLCYLQGPGFKSNLRPLEFFTSSPLNNPILTLTYVLFFPKAIRGNVKHQNKRYILKLHLLSILYVKSKNSTSTKRRLDKLTNTTGLSCGTQPLALRVSMSLKLDSQFSI